MIMYTITTLLILFSINLVNSTVIINRVDDECVLDPALVDEIKSYKDVVQRINDEITTGGLGETMYEEYTKFIDTFGARPAGSEVLERAIDYMVNLTKVNGISDVATEEVEVPHWVRGYESAVMLQPHHKKIAILGLGTSVSTPPEGITAEAIVVSSFDELDKIDNAKIKGKIVIFDAHFTTYGDTVEYRSNGATHASKKGAIATLVRSITPFSINSPHTGAQFYGDNVTKIPTACITLEDADLFHRLQDEGEKIIINMTMSSTSDTKISRNTIVDLKGKADPENVVIVSGHIDSWDVGTGAMDDGGGMFISWFAPILLNHLKLKPKRTVRAVLWTSEEPGLIGAAAYLKRHINELSNINFIMESDEGTFEPLGLEVAASKEGQCIIKELLKLFTPQMMRVSDSPGSDITLFVHKGVPGASLLNKNERYFWFHHSEGDTLNVQNIDAVINCAGFWASFAYVLADLSVDIPKECIS